jgi:predicted transcriptional regulator
MDNILLENEPKFKTKIFQDAFNNLKENAIVENNEIEAIINIYSKTKDLYIRNTCLKLLYNKESNILKGFFETAYKKERYLDMKINALRGLAHYITENEIKKLLIKFNETLKKRKETTPYNYQEYELLLGKNALPYLYKKYFYECIKETLEITRKQYNEMPEAFKGHFTVDEDGNTVKLRSPEETNRMITEFFEKKNK